MATPFTIPTYFTAVDKMSGPIQRMGRGMADMANRVATASSRLERGLHRLTPGFGHLGKKVIEASAAFFGIEKVFEGVRFSIDSMMEYQKELANLQALTGTSGAAFGKFRTNIQASSLSLRMSSVEVAKAYAVVANNQPELLKNADGLKAVTDASILLGKASRMETGPASEALTVIMNQFGLQSKAAAKTVDMLAAAQVNGSSKIDQTAEALRKFGAVAKVAGADYSNSITLVESVSKTAVGEEAGTALRNILLGMSKIPTSAVAGLKKYHVNMKLVQDKTVDFGKRLMELSKIQNDASLMQEMFGKRGVAVGAKLLSEAANFDKLKHSIEDSEGAAEKMAEVQENTLGGAFERMKARWVTLITSSSNADSAMGKVQKAVEFLTTHMEQIALVTLRVIEVFGILKGVVLITRAALFVYNVALGISAVLTRSMSLAMKGNAVALATYSVITKGVTAAQWLLNAAFWGCPITWIVAGVIALIAAIVIVGRHIKGWGKQWDATMVWIKNAFLTTRYALEYGWLSIRNAFYNMIEAVVKGWYWFKNKIGAMSDETYKKNISQIETEKQARLKTIDAVYQKMQLMQGKAGGPPWKLHWDDEVSPSKQAPTTPSVNPKAAQMQMIHQLFPGVKQQQLDINVSSAPGTSAAITGSTPGLKPNVKSTLPNRQGY